MSDATLTLISHHTCPYVQRAAIALAEKGVAFERINIDLSAKPDWFLAISPLGKVPLLKVHSEEDGDAIVFESNVICEYLEETQPGARLHPDRPMDRARHRGWMEFGSIILSDLWGLQAALSETEFAVRRQALAKKLDRIEREKGSGPFFEGERFTLVDAVFAPIFRTIAAIEMLTGIRLLDGFDGLVAWQDALASRPSVAAAVPDDYLARTEASFRRQGGYLSTLLP